MTGAELITFIQQNSLENEELTLEYFSAKKQVKFCGNCSSLVKLSNYHKGTSGADPSQSSFYRYICKDCFNKAAFHKKYLSQRQEKNCVGLRNYVGKK